MGWPLIRMDMEVHCRVRIASIIRALSSLPMTALVPVTALFLAASMARKNAADRCEQGGKAY